MGLLYDLTSEEILSQVFLARKVCRIGQFQSKNNRLSYSSSHIRLNQRPSYFVFRANS